MKELIEKLRILNNNYNIVGVKQSFEDEGVVLDDVVLMRRITELSGLYLNVKIGGCEAISDINNSISMGVDSIVAPMVETDFALQKFIESVSHIKDTNFYINIESKTAYDNIDSMLSSPSAKLLRGVVVGRSDLTKSYGLSKDDVDSDFISGIVKDILHKSKSYDYVNLMGGNISTSSSKFIKELYDNDLLDYIETRNIITKLDIDNTTKIGDTIKEMILFESDWLTFKSDRYKSKSKEYSDRSKTLINRIDSDE